MDNITKKFKFFDYCGYIPHPKQREIHFSNARFRIVAAGARGGKSFAAGAEIAFEALKPNRRIWIVSSQYELADKEFDWALHFLAKFEITPNVRAIDLGRLSSPARGSRSVIFPWGSFIETKSTQKPDSLLGEELDLMVLGEASRIPREPYERELEMRISSRIGKLLAISTPNMDSKLLQELYDKGQKGEKDWQSWQFTSKDNPSFSLEEYERLRKELPPEIFAEQCEGKFVSRRGKVFAIEDRHIISQLPSLENEKCLLGMQKGYKNAFVAILVYVVSVGNKRSYYVTEEIYEKEKLLTDLVLGIKDLTKGKHLLCTIVDFFDDNFAQELRKLGIATVNNDERKVGKNNATIKRIQVLQRLLYAKTEQKIFLHSSCTNLIRELRETTWPDPRKDESGQPEAEMPLLKSLQAPLALSYVLTFLENLSGGNVYG